MIFEKFPKTTKVLIIFICAIGIPALYAKFNSIGVFAKEKSEITANIVYATYDLDPGEQFVSFSWDEEGSFWICTKPMEPNHEPTTYKIKNKAFMSLSSDRTIVEHQRIR